MRASLTSPFSSGADYGNSCPEMATETWATVTCSTTGCTATGADLFPKTIRINRDVTFWKRNAGKRRRGFPAIARKSAEYHKH
ncbi:hypothetical protein CAJAP_00216 [Camponotus japonicus]